MNGRQLLAMSVAAGVGAALAAARRAQDSFSFAGKAALITGGSRGLGLVMARELVAQGAKVAILARDQADVSRAASELSERGGQVLAIHGDIRDQSVARRAVDDTVRQFGGIDVLINNAGVIQVGPLDHMTVQNFEEALGVHMWGPLYTTLAAVPHMRRQGGGRIVNISSVGGRVSVPHLLPYCASKFALVGLSDGLRAELAADDILVTTVCPGLMRTGSHLNALFKGRHPQEFTWFAIFDSLPLLSMDAGVAARQILDACRRGDPSLTLSLPARVLAAADALLPDLVASAMRVMGQLLPAAGSGTADQVRTGWESRSPLAPSLLTRLNDRAAVENNNLRGHAPPHR